MNKQIHEWAFVENKLPLTASASLLALSPISISGPLVIDVSLWDDHLNTDELLAGGVVSVILGLYKQWNKTLQKYVLNDNCKRIAEQVKASKLILQTYYYYYPQNDPIKEADWYTDIMFTNSMPAAHAWLDAEDHSAEMSQEVRSEQYRRFAAQVKSSFSNVGVYASRHFVAEYAPSMDKWLYKYPAWVPTWWYPAGSVMMDWATFKATQTPPHSFYTSAGQTNPVGHQFTGDRFRLPGVYDNGLTMNTVLYQSRMKLDVSCFTADFMKSIGANIPVPPPPPPPTYVDYKVNVNAVNIRKSPSSIGTWVRYAYFGEILHIEGHLTNGYVQMTDGNWVYQQYLIKAS